MTKKLVQMSCAFAPRGTSSELPGDGSTVVFLGSDQKSIRQQTSLVCVDDACVN